MTGFYAIGEAVIGSVLDTVTAPTSTSTVTSVTVTPGTATLAGGGTVDFDWVINGTNSPSQAATVATTLGTINSAGLLTAPAATSSAQTGTVTVTSTQDTTKSGTATFTVSALAGDTTGPVMQGAITATKTSTTTDLAWLAATDASGVAEYFVSKDGGAPVSTGTARSKSFTGLAPLSTHQYEITARDTAGNGSTNSLLVTVTTDADAVDPIPDPPQELKPVTIAQFRLDFPEFGNPTKYTDAQIRVQLVAASMVLGELQWGDLWGYGVELRTAHFLTIRARNLAAAAAGGVGGAVSGLLTSKAVDKVSASYDVGATTYEGAGFWNTSSYGIEFWQLLMMFGAGPIQL